MTESAEGRLEARDLRKVFRSRNGLRVTRLQAVRDVSFTIAARGDKVRDDHGNHLVNLQITFDAQFPGGAAGDSARDFLPTAMDKSHDWLCTVSRTVQLETPVEFRTA